MKRLVIVISLGLILASAGYAWSLRSQIVPVPPSTPSPPPPPAPSAPLPTFPNFPLDAPREVDLLLDDDALEPTTPRQREDQFLDWLLFTAVSDAGLSPAEMDEAMFDLPAVRHGYLNAVAAFEYGKVRSCHIGKGRVVAVLPRGSEAERADDLAAVVDRHAKDTGRIPETVLPFEYTLDLSGALATLTRRAPIGADRLFRPEAGHHSATIDTLDDLKTFMGQIDDLTSAEVRDGRVVLGGRKLQSRPYRRIGVEEVAAVWQSERTVQRRRTQFEKDIEQYKNDRTQRLIEVAAEWKVEFGMRPRWQNGRSRFELARQHEAFERIRAKCETHVAQLAQRLSKTKQKALLDRVPHPNEDQLSTENGFTEYVKQCFDLQDEVFSEMLAEKQKELRVSGGSGFSLDPAYDFPGLEGFWKKLCGEIASARQVPIADSPLTPASLAKARTALLRGDTAPLEELLVSLADRDGPLAATSRDMLYQSIEGGYNEMPPDPKVMAELFARIEASLSPLASGKPLPVQPEELETIAEQVRQYDLSGYLALLERLPQDDFLARAIGDALRHAESRRGLRWLVVRLMAGIHGNPEGHDLLELVSAKMDETRDNQPLDSVQVSKAFSSLADEIESIERLIDEVAAARKALRSGNRKPLADLVCPQRGDFAILRDVVRLQFGISPSLAPQRVEFAGASVPEYALRLAWIEGELRSLRQGHPPVTAAALRQIALFPEADRSEMAQQWLDQLERSKQCARMGLAGCVRLRMAPPPYDYEDFAKGIVDLAAAYRELQAHHNVKPYVDRVKQLQERWASGNDKNLPAAFRDLRFEKLAAREGDDNPLADAYNANLSRQVAERRGFSFQKGAEPLGVLERGLRALAEGREPWWSADKRNQIAQALHDRDVLPLLMVIDELEKTEDPFAEKLARFLKKGKEQYYFQAARYDGDLQGTEAGMVLFYTDLLAKIWALDYQRSAPQQHVADFQPMLVIELAPIYDEESKRLPHTRLWFGPLDRGFQAADEGRKLFLARNATRIYAASSNDLKPGVEVQANAASEAFLGWWNEHYEEVARFEPEYERLNQIMKWSIVISWLNAGGHGDVLRHLQDVQVTHGRWFSDWVRAKPELRFQDWSSVGFFPKDYLGTTTEAMQMLVSRQHITHRGIHALCGGVSLAPETLFKQRSPLPREPALPGLRSDIDYGSWNSGARSFKTFRETEFSFKPSPNGPSRVDCTPKPGTKLRAATSEMAVAKFTRSTAKEGPKTTIGLQAADHKVGNFRIATTEKGFRVGWAAEDVDLAHALARKIGEGSPARALGAPGVEAVFRLPEGDYLVRLRGSEKWARLKCRAGSDFEIGRPWQSRVAPIGSGNQSVDVAWLEPPAAADLLGRQESLQIPLGEKPAAVKIATASARGPPGKKVQARYGDSTFEAMLSADGQSVTVRGQDLPAALRERPECLARASRSGDQVVFEAPRRPQSTEIGGELRRGDVQRAARRIAENPNQAVKDLQLDHAETLRAINELIVAGKDVEAIRALDEAIATFGRKPELLVRRGMLAARRGRLSEAARAVEDAAQLPPGQRKAIVEEMQAVKTPPATPPAHENFQRAIDALRARDLQLSVAPVVQGDRLVLEGSLPEMPKNGRAATPGEVVKAGQPVWIADSPKLKNVDPRLGLEPALRQATSDGATIWAFDAPDLAAIAPDTLTIGARPTGASGGPQGRTFRLFGGSGRGGPAFGRPPAGQRVLLPGDGDDDDDDDEDADQDAVGIEKRQSSSIVYLVSPN